VTNSPDALNQLTPSRFAARFRLLQSVHFKEGAIVRQGDLLFQIDRDPSSGSRPPKGRTFSSQSAAVRERKAIFERAERLHNNDGMSAEEYDRRAAVRKRAEAKSRPQRRPFVARNSILSSRA